VSGALSAHDDRSASLVSVSVRCYVVRTGVEHEAYIVLTPEDVAEAFRRVTGAQRPGRFTGDGVRFDLEFGSCTITGSPSELRLRYEGASTGHLADQFTERLVQVIEEITGEAHEWERQAPIPS
jgi:hypothetical protein